jgi:hypothetical protein
MSYNSKAIYFTALYENTSTGQRKRWLFCLIGEAQLKSAQLNIWGRNGRPTGWNERAAEMRDAHTGQKVTYCNGSHMLKTQNTGSRSL